MISTILTTYQGAILGPIAKLLGQILEWLYLLMSHLGVENVGICMIIFTFLVNTLMLPLNVKQQKFAKMSSIMNPEIMAIQEKYKNKKDQESQQKMSLETQAVYQKYGVSPASGCLPMLITLPILFALYRVIYNVPAYVSPIYNMYAGVAEKVKDLGVTVEDLSKMTSSHTYVITNAVNAESKDINYYVDVLGQFGSDAWDQLADKCPSIAGYIDELSGHAMHINSFLGLNIADVPTIPFIGGAALTLSVLIPVLSVITQFISTKLSMASQPSVSSDNPTAASMKTMNNVMPFITGAMCFMFPIGVGIYWVAGNVFRIVQTLLINAYFKKFDMDDMIAKNMEKTKKRYEKMGIDPNTVLSDVSKQRTSKIESNKKNANTNRKTTTSQKVNKKASEVNFKGNTNKKYKEGSIAAYANMMSREDSSGDKKK